MAPRVNQPSPDLEAQLAGVLEQDGITMSSAEGIRRRVKRPRKSATAKTKHIPLAVEEPPSSFQDNVAELDVASFTRVMGSSSLMKERSVPVHNEPRPRSEFVLSLRGVMLAKADEPPPERFSVSDAFEMREDADMATSHETAVYGTLTEDLSIAYSDPAFFSAQFTPADFTVAYAASYGRFDRFTSAARSVAFDLKGFFQRVERIEHKAAEEIGDVVQVFEVPRLSFARTVIGFAALLLVVTLPANAVAVYRTAAHTQSSVEGAGNEAVGELLSVSANGSLPSTADSLKQASTKFREADAALTQSSALAIGIASVLPEKYRSARALLEVGDKSSQAARLIALAFDKVFSDPGRRLDERLDVLGAYTRAALPLLTDASRAAATIDPNSLPEDKRDTFVKLTAALQEGTTSIRDFAAMADVLASLSGKERARTYLLVFQNNTELRPTGGFMGSVAEVVMDRGSVAKIRVPPGGTYDLKGQLLEHVISPEPLHLINAHWQFQDANWFPDFPTSAEKIRWFWSKSGQPSLDGVIAINASFVEQLLDITGPIDMPAYGKVIDRSNFLIETQKSVEIEYDKEANTPKKFIGDLSDAMRERMKTFTSEDWMKVASLVSEGLETKEIQVALTDPDEQAIASRYGWSGQLKESPGDSLALIEANVAGQKTDGMVEEATTVDVEIQPDGSIIDTVTLTRTHTGEKGELFRGVRNVSYLRAYVPKGSRLISASGFDTPPANLFKKPDDDYTPDPDLLASEKEVEKGMNGVVISEEGSRNVFGGWMQLDPGKTQTITLKYQLPFKAGELHERIEASPDEPADARAAYLMLLTSQSGKTQRTVELKVRPPANWETAWARGMILDDDANLVRDGLWDRDHVTAALFAPSITQ
jgi:hypothetical protein